MSEKNNEKNAIVEAIMSGEIVADFPEDNIDLTSYRRIPFAELAALGAGFSTLPEKCRSVIQTVDNGPVQKLFRFDSHGYVGKLASRKDGSGYTTTIMGKDADGKSRIIGNGSYQEVTVGGSSTVSTVMPFDPTMLFMAAAMTEFNRKLEAIQEAQQNILDYIQQTEKAKLKGNVIFLADVFNQYKYNCENNIFKSGNHSQVLQIKREAEQSIILAKSQIEKAISKRAFIHMEKDVYKLSGSVQDEFKNYQLALYIFSFSSFLDVVLKENFLEEHLNSVSKRIRDYAYNYRSLYTQCYDQLEQYSKTSIGSHIASGIAGISKFTGNTVAKLPLISKTPIDEALLSVGNKVEALNSKKSSHAMSEFKDNLSMGANIFADNICKINQLFNESDSLLMDKGAIYIKE